MKIDMTLSSTMILLVCLLSFSCEKYVDIKKNGTQLLIETASDCQLLLDNYTNMNTGYPSDGEVSADDYYLSDAGYLLSSVTADDRNLYTWSKSAVRPIALPQWQSPYKVVYHSNLVLETLETLKGSTDQITINNLRGQALFFRSYAFFQIAQLYAKPYNSTSVGDLGIPLRLNSDINIKSERATLEQTYVQITNDLQEAVTLLPLTSIVATRPNQIAAYAMLARVYLSMGNYAQALTNASLVLQNNNQLIDFNTLSKTSTTPFSPRFNKEVIFHSVMTSAPTLNPSTATSNVCKIEPEIIALYASNDLRGQIFLKANSGIHAGSFRFTGNYEPTTGATLFNGLAVDEVYLIRAECYARIGNVNSAMADLNTLLRTRWVTNTYVNMTASTADEALVKVLAERRKELLMRGLRWTDLRRLNQESRFAKTLNRTINGTMYSLPPNDLRYTLLIPNEVVVNSGIQQNPR